VLIVIIVDQQRFSMAKTAVLRPITLSAAGTLSSTRDEQGYVDDRNVRHYELKKDCKKCIFVFK